MMARAQVSLEFLLVLTAFLAFLALWVPVQIELIETTKASLHAKQLQLALADVKATADAVCTLGNKNGKMIETKTQDAVLTAYNNTLEITTVEKTLSFKEQTRCALESKTIALNGTIKLTIANEKQEIKISIQ